MSLKLYSSKVEEPQSGRSIPPCIQKWIGEDLDTAACSPKIQRVVEPYLAVFADDSKIIPVSAEIHNGITRLWELLPKPTFTEDKISMHGSPTDVAAVLQTINALLILCDIDRLRADVARILEHAPKKPLVHPQSVLLKSDYSLTCRAQMYFSPHAIQNEGKIAGLYRFVLNPKMRNSSGRSDIQMDFDNSWWKGKYRTLHLKAVPDQLNIISLEYDALMQYWGGNQNHTTIDFTLPPHSNDTFAMATDFPSNFGIAKLA